MKSSGGHQYDDIINLPHHVSAGHPQMAMADRAAQFSPFAALTGYETAIQETARQTEEFVELDEDRKAELDEKFRMLRENQGRRPKIRVTYFQPDERKAGGAYETICGQVKRVDEYGRQIFFVDGTVLSMERILSMVSTDEEGV